MSRTINDAGLEIVKRNEGLKLAAYRDIAGIWTIGYGHTPARPGQVISTGDATALLRADLAHAEAAVDGATHDVATSDNEFSAFVSFTFNVGAGAFRSSTALRQHRAGDKKAAADALLSWSKAHVNGLLVIVPGLLRRRSEERALYLSPSASKDATNEGAKNNMPAPAQPIPAKPPASPLELAVAPARPARKPGPAVVDDSDAEAERLNRDELARF